jgi:hypothetical protein
MKHTGALADRTSALRTTASPRLIDFKTKTAPYKIDKPSHRPGRS